MRSSVSKGTPAPSSLARRMRRSARVISPACTTAAANKPYEATPKVKCNGSQTDGPLAKEVPGKKTANSTATAPITANRLAARMRGYSCCSTKYMVSISQAVMDSAGAKPKWAGVLNTPATSDSKCKPQAVYKLVRAWPARWVENAASK